LYPQHQKYIERHGQHADLERNAEQHSLIALRFIVQIAMADPAMGIIGATMMPHNLYLHSGLVQTRRFGDSVEDRREAIKLASIDSTIALMLR
jgi:Mn2+/Fe2+ NRAMP family transporter